MFKSGKLLKKKKLGWFDSLSLFNIAHFEEAETNNVRAYGFAVPVLLNDAVIDVD